jgi:hypothetical protein
MGEVRGSDGRQSAQHHRSAELVPQLHGFDPRL